jgi:hypothetical protein
MIATGSAEPAAKRPRVGLLDSEVHDLPDDQLLNLDLDGVRKLDDDGVQKWVEVALVAERLRGSIEDETRGIGKVLRIFRDNEVNGAALVNLTVEKMMHVGIVMGPAEVLYNRIVALKEAVTPKPVIHFTAWFGFPNGTGVLNRTAMPFTKLRKRIVDSAPGVYWLEAPPASGKTSLGQMLSLFDGFTVIDKQFHPQDIVQADLSSRVFIDEAQKLNLREVELLRGFGNSVDGNVVVCAGVSRHPSPHCPTCQQCKLCRTCLKHKCDHHGSCDDPQWQTTISMVICDTPTRRFTVDDLAADPTEVATFVKLFLMSTSACKPQYHGDPGDLANEMAAVLMERIGGLAGLLVDILREFFTGRNAVFLKQGLTIADFNKALVSMDTFNRVKDLRLAVQFEEYDKTAYDSLLTFMRTGHKPNDTDFEVLRKKALLRKDEADVIQQWSPLVHDVLWHKLFVQIDHEACPFTAPDDMVRFLVGKLRDTEFKSWVLDYDGSLEHEDSVNGAIAWLLKSSLPKFSQHFGPAKKSTVDAYMQVDHQIRWGDGTCWLLESCFTDPSGHCDRFSSVNGTYVAYGFSHGVLLWISKATVPRTKVNVPGNCAAFHMNVPSFSIRKWNGSEWCLT